MAAAVRADDRNEVDQQSARTASQRIADDLEAVTTEIEETGGNRAEIEDRIERDHARISAVQEALPGLEAEQAAAAERNAMVAEERRHIDARATELAGRRTALDARRAGLAERRRVLTERMAEVERRLTGHTDERQLAAERRRRLEGEATAIGRLAELVESCREELDVHLAGLREEHRRRLDAVRLGGERLESLRRQRTADEQRMTEVRARLSQVEMDLVEASVRREAVVDTLRRELGAGPEEATSAPQPDLSEGVEAATRIEQLEAELAAMGPVNPLALEELAEHTERHRFLESQVEDVRTARRELHQIIRTLDDEIMRVFAEAFADVNEHFSNLVSSLFPGGMGRLTLTDPEQLLETGVEVEARPAGRNVRRLSLLSGGERSLVAMAFLFAIFRSRPSPFYLMDEVEAALDDVNLQRFLGLVHEFRDEAQLIIVSHQKRTMEAADALYGVTMAPGGSSQVLSQRVPRAGDSPRPRRIRRRHRLVRHRQPGQRESGRGRGRGRGRRRPRREAAGRRRWPDTTGPRMDRRRGRCQALPRPRPRRGRGAVPSRVLGGRRAADRPARRGAVHRRAAGHRAPVRVGNRGDCLGGNDGIRRRHCRVRHRPSGGGRRRGGRGPPTAGTRSEDRCPTGRGGVRRRDRCRVGPQRGGHPSRGGIAAEHGRR